MRSLVNVCCLAVMAVVLMLSMSNTSASSITINTSESASSTSYNETEAKRYVDYAGAAYCCGGLGAGVANWTCRACKHQPGLQNITVLWNSRTNANGYIGYNAIGNFIIIAFSGTDPLSIKNWVDDINTLKQSYSWCSGCEVHKGFYNTYLSIQGQLQDAFYLLHRAYPTAGFQVTGHSLGAALTVHCALDIVQTFNVYPSAVYNFGQPRVGNDNFQQYYYNTIKTVWRLTHHKDPVPHLPFESWGFHQNAIEVFYNQKQTSYQLCNLSGEDKSCSDKYYLDANVFDHLNYVGFDFTANYLGCKL